MTTLDGARESRVESRRTYSHPTAFYREFTIADVGKIWDGLVAAQELAAATALAAEGLMHDEECRPLRRIAGLTETRIEEIRGLFGALFPEAVEE